jgi:flagellar hook-associated protein 3 FlgL
MTTGVSNLGQALTQIKQLKLQQSTLQNLSLQMTTGKKTQQFSGLGTDILTSQRARLSIQSIEQYQNNIANTNRRIEQMDNALSKIQEQAEILANSLTVTPSQGDYPDFETIQELAENAFDFLQDLYNDQDGDRYLFSGADTGTKPINSTGLFESFLGSVAFDPNDDTAPTSRTGVIGEWGNTLTTEEFIAAYRATDDTTLGYSASLSNGVAGKTFARVDDNAQLDYTTLANSEGMREVIIAVGVLKQLPPPEHAPGALNDPTATTFGEDTAPYPPAERQENFFAVIDDIAGLLNGAIDKINDDRYKLAQVQVQMDTLNESYTLEKKAFQDSVAEVENVDDTEVAVKINAMQIQLEASYTVTAAVSQLSFVNFFN